MPLPSSIAVSGYRSFAQRQVLELRPLTLLYGRNNAGKSALLRLLPLLEASLDPQLTTPLNLDTAAVGDSTFARLTWAGDSLYQLRVAFHWKKTLVTSAAYLIKDRDNTHISELVIHTDNGKCWRASATPVEVNGRIEHHLSEEGSEQPPLNFEGLMPKTSQPKLLSALHHQLAQLRGQVQWLKSVRKRPSRLVQKRSTPRLLEPAGGGAPSVLLGNRDILKCVADWYARPEIARRLSVSRVDEYHDRILLRHLHMAADIDLIDTGEGMIQVLPVLVAVAMATCASNATSRIIAIEEPESHLHPRAQRALADHLCTVAATDNAPILVLETHSPSMMLGLQLAIARGVLPRERACVYWVDQDEDGSSHASLVEFDDLGRPIRGWPPGVFAEERELARELLSEQLGAKGGAFANG